MSKFSRDKGIRFELAMAALFRRVFPAVYRGKQNDDPKFCDLEATPIRWELKHWKNWPSAVRAVQQCEKNAAEYNDDRPRGVILKRDFSEPFVVMKVLDFLKFCEENLYSPTNDNVIDGPWEDPPEEESA